MDNYQHRLEKLRQVVKGQPLAVSNPVHIRYLTGFTGTSALVLITAGNAIFFTDFRYKTQAKEQVPSFYSVIISKKGLWRDLTLTARRLHMKELGLEGEHVSWTLSKRVQDMVKGLPFLSLEGEVEAVRLVKDEQEIEHITKAAAFIDDCFTYIAERLRPGLSERQVAEQLEAKMKELGAEGPSFPAIVASGPRGALPHAVPSERVLEKGDLVTIDMGAQYAGYCSDCTRTFCLGKPSAKQEEIYGVVWQALQTALQEYRPGVSAARLDSRARQVIQEAGYGRAFGHALGHGVGLEIHERPTISQKSPDTLKEGMVVTCEPGIYVDGWGGVRLEELVLITKNGHNVLSRFPNPAKVLSL